MNARKYDREVDWHENMAGISRMRARLAREHARGLVLEVGVGTGRNFQYNPPGSRIVGIDFSNAMLDVAAERGGCWALMFRGVAPRIPPRL